VAREIWWTLEPVIAYICFNLLISGTGHLLSLN